MKKIKNPITLIEVLIASLLTMIILTGLTFFFAQVMSMNATSEKLQKEQFKLGFLEKRLATILPKVISPTDPSKDFYFFTSEALNSGQSLVFTYDNGVQLSKEHSNHLLGRLFLDEGNLVLASITSPKRWELFPNPTLQREVLLENVTSLQFEFYVPPKKDRSALVSQNPSIDLIADNQWHKSWSPDFKQLPAMIKIHIKKDIQESQETILFAFPLPKSTMVIL